MQDAQHHAPDQMIAAPKSTSKLVKIRAVQPIRVGDDEIGVGQVVEVTEADAKEFCRPLRQHFSFDGERSDRTAERHTVVRAELVKQ